MTDMTAKALATQLILLNSNWGMSSLHLEWTRSLPPPFFFLLRVSFKHHKSREATFQVLWLLTSCLSREPHAQCPSRADQLCCTLWELWSTTVRWSSALPPKRCCELFARSQRFQSILSKSSSVLLHCPRSISSVWTSRSVSKGQGQWGQRRPRVLQLLVLDSQPWMTHRRFVGPSGQTMRRRCRACQSRRRQCLLLWLHCQNKHLWTSSKYPQCSSPPASDAPSLSFLQHHSMLATCSLGGHSLWGDVEHACPTRWSAFSLLCQIVALLQSPADLWVKLLRAAWCNPSALLPGFASKHRLSFSQCWTPRRTLPWCGSSQRQRPMLQSCQTSHRLCRRTCHTSIPAGPRVSRSTLPCWMLRRARRCRHSHRSSRSQWCPTSKRAIATSWRTSRTPPHLNVLQTARNIVESNGSACPQGWTPQAWPT